MRIAPLQPRPPYASARAGRLPGKSTRISSATAPKMVNSGVCEPPPTAKATAAEIGSMTAARPARRSASNSGSRARIRSRTWRSTAAVSVGKDLDSQHENADTDEAGHRKRLLPPWQRGPSHGQQCDHPEFRDQD